MTITLYKIQKRFTNTNKNIYNTNRNIQKSISHNTNKKHAIQIKLYTIQFE